MRILLLILISVSCFGQSFIGVDLTTNPKTYNLDGSISCTNIVQSDIYGINESFDESYTIALTRNNWAQITNATQTLWTLNCENGFTSTNDTLICDKHGSWGGMLSIYGTGGNGNDYEVRLYDITAGTEVAGMLAYFTSAGTNNYTGGVVSICFESIINHRYVWQIRNTTDNDDFTTISGKYWMILMKE